MARKPSLPSAPPLDEEQLKAVTIGTRVPLNSTIELVAYDSEWPKLYAKLEGLVRAALGSNAVLIEHVGSTSVPGLSAKPIIDMILAVEDSADENAYVPQLEKQGFRLHIREPDWFEHRLLKAPNISGNLHVFSAGCEEMDRMLLFRDWLRAHDEERALYERTKKELASRVWQYTQHYADAKADVVRAILSRAIEAH